MDHRDAIPEDVYRFILLGIPSVPYLEALLLLQADPGRHWTCEQVAQRLYLTEKACQPLLQELLHAGVAATDPQQPECLRYAPQTAELAQMVERLAQIYPRNIIAVSKLIHSKASNSRAQQFADAFVMRKEI